MNGDAPAVTPPVATDPFNQWVRGGVVAILTIGFFYGFVITKVVSTESFAVMYGVVLGYWFGSGKRTDDAKAAAISSPATP